ncbi:MAG: PD-(D/E)XK nuclease family protein [Acutalibacteraceae bacterium]|jgi:ATP-dependent helicase/nuclease subunit B
MLQLIFGRSGFGKTERIYDQIDAWADDTSAPRYLLVPEQFSFESERALLRRLDAQRADRIRVVSFSRLSELLCPPTGAGRLDDAARVLLMSEAIHACADRLTLYRRQASDPDTVSCLLDLLIECRQCGISTAMMRQTAAALPDGALKNKTDELALILEAYDALVSRAYRDPLDDLAHLEAHLQAHPLPERTRIAVDGFNGFTGQEMRVLGLLIAQAEQVTVALCADGAAAAEDTTSPLATVNRTADRLIRLAKDARVPIAAPIHLKERRRTDDPALNAIESGLFAPVASVYDRPTEAVTLLRCDDIYDECETVARLIRRQCREKGGQYRDFAIVARRLDDYRGVLDAALEKQEIPYYLDARRDVMSDSLYALVIAALQVAGGDWNSEYLLRIAKSGLTGLSGHSAALLENYAYLWRINGRRWRQEWVDHPDGLSVREDDDSRFRLHYLNLLRRRLVDPLEELSAALHRGAVDGEAFAKAVYRYLLRVKADKLLRLQVEQATRANEKTAAQRAARLWPLLIDQLDMIARTLKEHPLPAQRMIELFLMICSQADLGEIPQTLDGVQIGSADRMRFASPRTVFVLGANEGVFPAYPAQGNLWSCAERTRLIEAGLPLTDNDEDVLAERFYVYHALSAPHEKLVISYPQSSTAGEPLQPSIVVSGVQTILPGCSPVDSHRLRDAESAADMLDQVARGWHSADVAVASMREALRDRPAMRDRLAIMESAAEDRPAAFSDEAVARRFFGDDLWLSPSQVEKYHECRFSYFCRYGLRVFPRRVADLDPSVFGTMTHYVMERLLPGYARQGFDKITRRQIAADTAGAVDDYVAELMGGTESKPARFAYLLTRLKKLCERLMWQVVREMRQSRFVPVDYELTLNKADDDQPHIDPVVLTLPDGVRIRVIGKIDRVDVFKQDGTSYVRVIDYKTSHKEFRLSDVVQGLNLQMMIYMLSIWQNGGVRYGDVRPAGLLYLPANLPVLNVAHGADDDALDKADLKGMRMNGLLLDNDAVLRAMEADAGGLFIPATATASGQIRKSDSLASLAQFGQLKVRVEKLLGEMALTLRRGDIAAQPAYNADHDACQNCDYKAVCGFEKGRPVRAIAKTGAKEVWQALDNEENHDEQKLDR